MEGQKADCVFTDSPYNVNYNALNKAMRNWAKDWNYCAEWKDKMSDGDFSQFYVDVLKNIKDYSISGAHIYVWFAFSSYHQLREAILAAGLRFDPVPIIWKKNIAPISWARYHRNYEPRLFLGNEKVTTKKGKWYGPNNEVCVWEISSDATQTYVHPTQKPVALAVRALNNSSRRGDVVLDLFGGSGSIMMACEQLGRKCRMIEVEPIYVDVIIRRWEQKTGKKAVKL
jgi:DNA modification methylase